MVCFSLLLGSASLVLACAGAWLHGSCWIAFGIVVALWRGAPPQTVGDILYAANKGTQGRP